MIHHSNGLTSMLGVYFKSSEQVLNWIRRGEVSVGITSMEILVRDHVHVVLANLHTGYIPHYVVFPIQYNDQIHYTKHLREITQWCPV
jgi:hypothetical protein